MGSLCAGLKKKKAQDITEYSSLYLKFPAQQVPGYYLAYNYSAFVSSVCPRFDMIQSFSLVCVKAHSRSIYSESPPGRYGRVCPLELGGSQGPWQYEGIPEATVDRLLPLLLYFSSHHLH